MANQHGFTLIELMVIIGSELLLISSKRNNT
ncbi:TPA: prepilin-type N-terminal cleavage/methylation domain-containing protein [Yersinia enterocolitica]